MARYVAVSEVPGLTNEQFCRAFDAIRKWRFDRRAWIVKAYCDLSGGRLFVECEAPDQEIFAQWLRKNEWQAENIREIDLIYEAGSVWPMGAPAGAQG